MNPIPEEDLIVGHLYRVRARNLEGPSVYIGEGKFLGIREKLGVRFTETELLNIPANRPFNTCTPLEDLGPIPKGIELKVYLPTVDRETLREVDFDRPISDGGRGWYFVDTGEASMDIFPIARRYAAMYEYLEEMCRKYQENA